MRTNGQSHGIMLILDPPHLCGVTHKINEVTRRSRGNEAPKDTDSSAWRLNGGRPRIAVFRSPLDHEVWLTREEREAILKQILTPATPFKRGNGVRVLTKIEEGSIAYFMVPGNLWRRVRKQRVGDQWVSLGS